ncbi:MAG: acetoacetate decarboxylase family protein [Candidatus Binatia bacterium]
MAEPTAFVVQGRPIALPVQVRDAVSITATFTVPTVAVRRLVPHGALRIPEIMPGRALCVLAAVEYRDNDLGQYNEVAVSFLVESGKQPSFPLVGLLRGLRRHTIGAYIHRLPVTTTFSRDVGRDVWGFPKTVDDITFTEADGWRTARLVVGRTHALSLSVRRGGRRRMAATPQDSWAARDGVLWRTPSVMSGEGVGVHVFGGARLELGAHPIGDELRSLGLPHRPLVATYMARMRASFDAPEHGGAASAAHDPE